MTSALNPLPSISFEMETTWVYPVQDLMLANITFSLKKKSKKSCCEKFRKGKRCKSCPFADREGTLHLAKLVSGTQIGGRVIQIST